MFPCESKDGDDERKKQTIGILPRGGESGSDAAASGSGRGGRSGRGGCGEGHEHQQQRQEERGGSEHGDFCFKAGRVGLWRRSFRAKVLSFFRARFFRPFFLSFPPSLHTFSPLLSVFQRVPRTGGRRKKVAFLFSLYLTVIYCLFLLSWPQLSAVDALAGVLLFLPLVKIGIVGEKIFHHLSPLAWS